MGSGECGVEEQEWGLVRTCDLRSASLRDFVQLASCKQGAFRVEQIDFGGAVFVGGGGGDAAAQVVGEQLHAVADAEHGQAGLEHVGGQGRRARLVDAGRAAAQDEALDLLAGQRLLCRLVPMNQLRVNGLLAHPPGDQLRVLGAEVEDDDGVVSHGE